MTVSVLLPVSQQQKNVLIDTSNLHTEIQGILLKNKNNMEISMNDRIQKRANKIGSKHYHKAGASIRQELEMKALSALLSNSKYTYNYATLIQDCKRIANEMLFSMAKEEILQELESHA